MALTDKLTAVGDALRRNLGSDEKIALTDMPGEIDRVYQKGEEAFLDNVPKGMDRYHFAGGGWNVHTFYPRGKYVCITEQPQSLFAYHNRQHEAYDMAQRIAECGAEFSFADAVKVDYAFYCANITALPALDFAHFPRLMSTFSGCAALHTIAELKVGEAATYSSTFAGCTSLVNLKISGTIGQNGFNVSDCPLSVESLRSILAALKPDAGKSINLGANNLAKLTQEELDAAAELGWSVV